MTFSYLGADITSNGSNKGQNMAEQKHSDWNKNKNLQVLYMYVPY